MIRPNNSECEVAAKAKAGVAIDDAAAQAQASGRQSAGRAVSYRPMLRFLATQDRNVIWLLPGIALLPVDGTTLGLYAPFWSPISPVLFAVYCLCNWRQLHIVAVKYLPLFLLPVVCIILSIPGWLRFGIHFNAAFMSLTGLFGMLATLGALVIAFHIKRIPWNMPIRLLIAAYWCSFAVGVVQWFSIHLRFEPLVNYFSHLMYRQYITDSSVWGGGRSQFLFAEPSYIGMHLFGILLPLMWLMRGRDSIYAKRLRDLIVVYAIGAMLMQAGTRIVIDSVVALLVAIIVHNTWHDRKQRLRGMAQFAGACLLGLMGVLADSRLTSIAENGAQGGWFVLCKNLPKSRSALRPAHPPMDHVHRLWCGQHHQCGVGWRIQGRAATKWSWHERRRSHRICGRHECGHRMDDVCVYQRRRRIRIDRPGSAGHRFHSFHDACLRYCSCRAWCLEQDCYLLACPDRVPVYPVRELRVRRAAIVYLRGKQAA